MEKFALNAEGFSPLLHERYFIATDQQIEVHRSLTAEKYQETLVAKRGQTITVPFYLRWR